MSIKTISMDAWNLTANSIHDYLKIKYFLLEGNVVFLTDIKGSLCGFLKICNIDNVNYVISQHI